MCVVNFVPSLINKAITFLSQKAPDDGPTIGSQTYGMRSPSGSLSQIPAGSLVVEGTDRENCIGFRIISVNNFDEEPLKQTIATLERVDGDNQNLDAMKKVAALF